MESRQMSEDTRKQGWKEEVIYYIAQISESRGNSLASIKKFWEDILNSSIQKAFIEYKEENTSEIMI